MNKRLKAGAILTSASVIAVALLIAIPSGPFVDVRLRIVSAAPSFDNTTRIYEVDIDNSVSVGNCQFFDNDTTNDVDVGYTVIRLQVHVYINKDYAATENAAHANTRVYMTIRKPDNTIHYENYLDNTTIISDYTTYWKLVKRDNSFTPFALTEGTWTVTTKYDVYA